MIDEYFNKVSLLLPLKAPNVQYNLLEPHPEFKDYSPEKRTMDVTGMVTLATGISRHYDSSVYFSSSYLHVVGTEFGLRNFCVEAQVKYIGHSFVIFDSRFAGGTGIVVYIDEMGKLKASFTDQAEEPKEQQAESYSPLTPFTWYHISLIRTRGAVHVFADGVRKLKLSDKSYATGFPFINATNFNSISWKIGAAFDNSIESIAYMNDFRITIGEPRYISNWTHPWKPHNFDPPGRLVGCFAKGIVKKNNVPLVNKTIVSHATLGPNIVNTTKTDSNGEFFFTDLVNTEQYLLCFNDDGSNALIYGKIKPLPITTAYTQLVYEMEPIDLPAEPLHVPIVGKVKKHNGKLVKRPIIAHVKERPDLIFKTESNEFGEYTFDNLPDTKFYIVCLDDNIDFLYDDMVYDYAEPISIMNVNKINLYVLVDEA